MVFNVDGAWDVLQAVQLGRLRALFYDRMKTTIITTTTSTCECNSSVMAEKIIDHSGGVDLMRQFATFVFFCIPGEWASN